MFSYADLSLTDASLPSQAEPDHAPWIEIDSFAWGTASSGISAARGQTGSAGKATLHDFHITIKTCTASPQLMQSCAMGDPIKEIKLTLVKADQNGRVKVQFHWDREGMNDAGSSCWVRVASLWAGKQWGMIHIPRIGQEVVVDFVEGDLDQPIIIGIVYNADQMPPYAMPADKTQSGIKTNSSWEGMQANPNELQCDEQQGRDELRIGAAKNPDLIDEGNRNQIPVNAKAQTRR
jgi:hypothetical protein